MALGDLNVACCFSCAAYSFRSPLVLNGSSTPTALPLWHPMNKVLLVSEDPHVARKLSAACSKSSEVFWAHDQGEALSQLVTGNLPIVVVDETAANGNGLQLLEEIAQAYPDTVRVFVTSQIDLESAVHLTNQVGVFRLLAKPASTDDFVLAVNAAVAAATSRLVSTSVKRQSGPRNDQNFLSPNSAFPHNDPPSRGLEKLTQSCEGRQLSPREREILLAVVQGKKPVQIAQAFFISVHTARNHIKALYRKFDVHSQVELIARVLQTPGIVELSSGTRQAS